MTPEVWIALIGGIMTLSAAIIKQHYNHVASTKQQKQLAKLITDKDLKQDAELRDVSEKVDKIASYVSDIEYRKTLLLKLRKNTNNIIAMNSLDNTELISLLNNTRDKYINIIENILDTKVEDLNVDDIKADIKTFAKYIRIVTNFKAIDVKSAEDFCNRLKQDVVIVNMGIFTMRIEDEIIKDSNKYNGTFEKVIIGVLNTLITDIIKTYRDCKKN